MEPNGRDLAGFLRSPLRDIPNNKIVKKKNIYIYILISAKSSNQINNPQMMIYKQETNQEKTVQN
jgi:hypothetical protein